MESASQQVVKASGREVASRLAVAMRYLTQDCANTFNNG